MRPADVPQDAIFVDKTHRKRRKTFFETIDKSFIIVYNSIENQMMNRKQPWIMIQKAKQGGRDMENAAIRQDDRRPVIHVYGDSILKGIVMDRETGQYVPMRNDDFWLFVEKIVVKIS